MSPRFRKVIQPIIEGNYLKWYEYSHGFSFTLKTGYDRTSLGWTLTNRQSIIIDQEIRIRIITDFLIDETLESLDMILLIDASYGTIKLRQFRYYFNPEDEERSKKLEKKAFEIVMERSSCVPVDIFTNPDLFIKAWNIETERRCKEMMKNYDKERMEFTDESGKIL